MKILFDARMMGEGFGIGVYIRELTKRLVSLGAEHKWLFLVRPEGEEYAKENLSSPSSEIVVANIPHYSLAEQLHLLKIFNTYKPDLVHFPNFNIPILFKGRFIVTIHDLVHHKLPGHRRSSWYRRAAYRLIMKKALFNSEAIITVSKASKQDIVTFFPRVSPDKIFVVTEGISPDFNSQELPGEIYSLREKYKIEQPYLLFVGVWEVKKNLPFLVRVFAQIADKYPDLKLVLAGKPDPWHSEVKNEVLSAAGKYRNRITIPGFVSALDLPALYRQSAVFVNPSLYEGFGLPGLEAMGSGVPVAVADTSVFREVYDDGAAYFDYHDLNSAAQILETLLDSPVVRSELAQKGVKRAKNFTWEDAAIKTISVYDQVGK